jgi:ABC-type multidrug transport system ATPase subunit
MEPDAFRLVAEGVGLRYGRRWAFRGIDVRLPCGSVLAVTGRNGSGKSSLLRVFAGLSAATEGTVAAPPPGERGMAALDQRLYGALTPWEHVQLAAQLHGRPPAREPLDEAGLALDSDRPASSLSSGRQARLKLLLATLHGPRLLLLDEPSVALDDEGRTYLAGLVARSRASGAAVVLATNDPGDLRHADHGLELAG